MPPVAQIQPSHGIKACTTVGQHPLLISLLSLSPYAAATATTRLVFPVCSSIQTVHKQLQTYNDKSRKYQTVKIIICHSPILIGMQAEVPLQCNVRAVESSPPPLSWSSASVASVPSLISHLQVVSERVVAPAPISMITGAVCICLGLAQRTGL